MNILIWVITGGIIGFISFSYFRANANYGKATSVIIGMIGSMVGGEIVAPVLTSVPTVLTENAFNPFAFAVAAALAIASLTISHMLTKRYDL